MDKKISLGNDIFDQFMEDNGYYVDKTELIYELAADNKSKVTLFTRPRRFGKSLIMSMLESFFDIRRSGSNIFNNLNIMKNHPDFCKEWMHQYPTILLSLKDVEGLNFEDAYAMFRSEISKLCSRNTSLELEKALTQDDISVFRKLRSKTATIDEVKNSLQTLMRMMHSVYGKQVILLIDEYDVPLAKAYEHGYYREMVDVIRGIMSISLKSNEYLKFAVVTGCLRISKESIFTGVNNFSCYSVMHEKYSQYFGFTEDEVIQMLDTFGLADKLSLVKKWYDGYLFGDTEIYCPWDVANYISDAIYNKDANPKNYWENTSGNGAIKEFFKLDDEDISDKFEILLNGGTIVENVVDTLTYEEAYTSISNLWSVLLMTGYVTTVKREKEVSSEVAGISDIELRIPNREVAGIFQKAVIDNFQKTVDQSRILKLMEALWSGDEDTATNILSDLLFETISYMDYHENYYHAFMSGIFTGRGYMPKSNQENGLGRPDVCLRDRRNRRMLVMECKKADSEEKLDYFCDQALEQIVSRKYTGNTNGYKTVLCYGIAFFEKSAKVKLLNDTKQRYMQM